MGARLVRRWRRRLTHYWDQHPLHHVRAHALRAGLAAAVGLTGLALVIRAAPGVVIAGLIVMAGGVVAWEAFGHLLEARLDAERDERLAVRLKSALALRRRRVQRLLDEYVAEEIQAELLHEIGGIQRAGRRAGSAGGRDRGRGRGYADSSGPPGPGRVDRA